MFKRAAAGALGLLLLISPAVASALTPPPPDDYGDGTPNAGIYCPDLKQTLKRGARDSQTHPPGQVTELQIFLADYYSIDEEDIVTGYFGAFTHRTVVRFQTEQGLPAFGIVGELTRAKIKQVCGGATTPSASVDLKVAGQDGPVTVTAGTIASVSWKTVGMSYCELRGASLNEVMEKGLESGSLDVPIYSSTVFSMKCSPSNQNLPAHSDSVVVNVTGGNGGKCGLNTFSVSDVCDGGFRNVYFQCYDGYSATLGGGTSCKPSTTWHEYATAACANRCAPPPSGPIKVTAPNGGEQWEIGVLNTITWSPYGYNPDINPARDVIVNLERVDGQNVGQVMDTGKASLHTYFNIDNYQTWAQPGQYKIRVQNRVTGAVDRSDAPFTLLPRAADVKVNGSDGPVSVSDSQKIHVSFTANHDVRDCVVSNVRSIPGGPVHNVGVSGTSGTIEVFAVVTNGYGNVQFQCQRSNGGIAYDTVQLTGVPVAASLQVVSPNGGESFDPRLPLSVKWTQAGLSKVSIALYKSDQFYGWLIKDSFALVSPDSWFGIPNEIMPLPAGLGKVWKVYMTGLKQDGSGYVDDKSDGPFEFVGPYGGPTSIDIKANGSDGALLVPPGTPVTLTWKGQGDFVQCTLNEELSGTTAGNVDPTGSFQPAPPRTAQRWVISCLVRPGLVPGDVVKDTVLVNVLPDHPPFVGKINAAGTTVYGGVSGPVFASTVGVTLAKLTFTATPDENVRLNRWQFTIRNVASGGTKAVDLTVTAVNIGGKEYPVDRISDGLYSIYQVRLGAGQDFAAGIQTPVSIHANTGNQLAPGGTVDLWWYPGDMTFTGVTSGVNIVPTSTVEHRGDHIYWSGWLNVLPPPTPPPVYSQATYYSQAAYVPPPVSCTLDGVTVAHGSSRNFYSVRDGNTVGNAADPLSSLCSSYVQSRTCNNGTLTGDPSYQYASCFDRYGNHASASRSYIQSQIASTLAALEALLAKLRGSTGL